MGIADKAKNTAQDLAGKAKEALGDAKNDDELKAEGKTDQTKASAKQAGENVKDVFRS
ncbi:CsbD family protein [Nocardioides zeae]